VSGFPVFDGEGEKWRRAGGGFGVGVVARAAHKGAIILAYFFGPKRSTVPTLAEVESEYIRETLTATRGNKTEAARILGISRKNLYERLAREEKRDG